MRKWFLASVLSLVLAGGVLACPFCLENKGNTLVGEYKAADMVLVGKFERTSRGKLFEESDFKISEVLKSHEFIKGKDTITIPGDKRLTSPFLIFVEIYKGDPDAYRGVEILDKSEVVDYLKGAIKLADAPPAERLRFAFKYLPSEDFEISLDAYREFGQAEYKDYKEMAMSLPPDTIAGWLQSPKTPPYRYGLFASLLGHAGLKDPARYGKVLKGMIDDPDKRRGSGIDGLLAGYAMLQPSDALAYLKENLGNPKMEFLMRYACLRTVRFMWEQRPDLISDKEMVESLMLVANTPDMADFAIDDLRRWNRWEAVPRILKLYGQPGHDTTLIRRSIIRFALHADAQGNAEAASFLASLDRSIVDPVRKLLESEGDLRTRYRRTPEIPKVGKK